MPMIYWLTYELKTYARRALLKLLLQIWIMAGFRGFQNCFRGFSKSRMNIIMIDPKFNREEMSTAFFGDLKHISKGAKVADMSSL